jgi:CDP-2,3-bis-(O-geranylgeranyl)-sn-glycerol synthase
MFVLVIKILYFGLPVIVANSLPTIFAKLKWLEFLDHPVDFKIHFSKQPLFGRTKTWRGFIVGIPGGILFIFLQRYLNRYFPVLNNYSLVNYESQLILLYGFLLSFGALFGDLVKSFIKRRFRKSSGDKWWPWDIVDSTLGSLFFVSIFIKLGTQIILISIILGPIIHVLANAIGFKLKIKDVWW